MLSPDLSTTSGSPSGLTVTVGRPGIPGVVVSTTRLKVPEVATLPAASLTVAVRAWVPLTSGVVRAKFHAPSASVVAVPSRVVPS
ncbi:hypothetical protein D3C75_1150050 [compost metagenome]